MITRLFVTSAVALVALAASPANASIIGFDDFGYSNGSINGQSGGTNWNLAGGVSDWNGTASVQNDTLVTNSDIAVYREYGENESASAIQTGQLFFRFTITYGSVAPDYALLSSFDLGVQEISFGRFTNSYGIEETGIGSTAFASNIQFNSTVTMVGVIDFTNALLALFVNPDTNDFYDSSGGTADVTRILHANSPSTRIQLQSGGATNTSVTWDNVIVATTPSEADIPEPGTTFFVFAGFGIFLARRRKNL